MKVSVNILEIRKWLESHYLYETFEKWTFQIFLSINLHFQVILDTSSSYRQLILCQKASV